MQSYKVVADIADTDTARRLASALAELLDPPPTGLTLFEADGGWRIELYFDDIPELKRLNQQIAAFIPGEPIALRIEEVPDANWVEISQAGLPPVIAGRFTVHGSHDRYRIPNGPNAILIDAGEAFGTAHHATTFSCLLAIDEATRSQPARSRLRSTLDLGCGTGVLAIAMARALPHADIVATDIDPDSVRVAKQNAKLNGAANSIVFATANGPPETGFGFDLVVANILAGPLIAMAPAITLAVAPGGKLLLSGILSPQAPAVQARYRSLGFQVLRHRRVSGWSTFTLDRR